MGISATAAGGSDESTPDRVVDRRSEAAQVPALDVVADAGEIVCFDCGEPMKLGESEVSHHLDGDGDNRRRRASSRSRRTRSEPVERVKGNRT
jgi:hypothetical protein